MNRAKVVVVRSSLGDARLGLSDEVYERIASEASIVLHLAWSVNFRMRLRSFEKDNIAGELAFPFSDSLTMRASWMESA